MPTPYPPLNEPPLEGDILVPGGHVGRPARPKFSTTWQQFFSQLQAVFGPGGFAPADAEFVLGTANGLLPNGRVVTDTATVDFDIATAGQLKANVPDAAITFAKMQNIATQTLIGRNTAGTGSPESVTISQALDWLGE